jgi:hypothetical protein
VGRQARLKRERRFTREREKTLQAHLGGPLPGTFASCPICGGIRTRRFAHPAEYAAHGAQYRRIRPEAKDAQLVGTICGACERVGVFLYDNVALVKDGTFESIVEVIFPERAVYLHHPQDGTSYMGTAPRPRG